MTQENWKLPTNISCDNKNNGKWGKTETTFAVESFDFIH